MPMTQEQWRQYTESGANKFNAFIRQGEATMTLEETIKHLEELAAGYRQKALELGTKYGIIDSREFSVRCAYADAYGYCANKLKELQKILT